MLAVIIASTTLAASSTIAISTPPAQALSAGAVNLPTSLSAPNLSALSDAVAQTTSSSSSVVVLAANGDEASFAQAAANARLTGHVALMARSSEPAHVLAQLQSLAATTVKLVGSPSSFSSSFISTLQGAYTVDTTWITSDSFSRSAAATSPTARARIVVTDAAAADVRAIATSLAITSNAALVFLDGQEDLTASASVLSDPSNALITVVGPASVVAPNQNVGQPVFSRTVWLDTTSIVDAEQRAIEAMISAGTDARRVVAATETGLASRALAGLAASAADALVGTQVGITNYVSRLRSTLDDAATVGTTATAQKTAAITAARPAAQTPPPFRVLDVLPASTGTSYTVTTTSVTGATSYAAFDEEGNQVGTSTTTTITIGGEPRSVALAASSTTGRLAEAQMRINAYQPGDDRAEIVVATEGDGRHHLEFLSGSGVARVITRRPVDVFGMNPPDEQPPTETIGVTCEASFTSPSPDGMFQYDYRATTLNNDREVCGLTPSVNPDLQPLVGGVSFPPTDFPMFARGDSQDIGSNDGLKASRSLMARLMTPSSDADGPSFYVRGGGSSARIVPGDGWPDLLFRYQGWIRQSSVGGPPPSGRLTRPYTFFHGDSRGADPNGTYRFRQDVRLRFGTNHNIFYEEKMGETLKYACRTKEGADCEFVSRATAPLSQLDIRDVYHTSTYGWWYFHVDAANPLQPLSPAISSEMYVIYGPGITDIIGLHDKMPSHEIYFRADGWGEWETAYESREVGLHCLFPNVPFCTQKVNIRL